MPGIRALRKIQLGAEVTPGASTDIATTVWRGDGMLVNNTEITFPEESIGILGGTDRSYISKYDGSIELSGDLTFEQFGYIANAGIKKSTPTTDSGSGLLWSWAFPLTSTDAVASTDLTTLVIEGGDNAGAEVMHYGFVPEFSIEGAAGEALMLTATVQGQQIVPSPFTAGLAIPTVETVLASKGRLYIDDDTGTIGSTQISQSLLSMSLSVNTGWIAVPTIDGALTWTFVKQSSPEITLEVTFEHDANGIAEKAKWLAQTSRLIRLQFAGNALTSAGTYTTKLFTIDLAGKWETFSGLDEQDGNDIVTGTFRARYNATSGLFAQIAIVNELAAMP